MSKRRASIKKLLLGNIRTKLNMHMGGIDFSFPEKYKDLVEEIIKEQDWFFEDVASFTIDVEYEWKLKKKFPFIEKVRKIPPNHTYIYFKGDFDGVSSLSFLCYGIYFTKESLLLREKER